MLRVREKSSRICFHVTIFDVTLSRTQILSGHITIFFIEKYYVPRKYETKYTVKSHLSGFFDTSEIDWLALTTCKVCIAEDNTRTEPVADGKGIFPIKSKCTARTLQYIVYLCIWHEVTYVVHECDIKYGVRSWLINGNRTDLQVVSRQQILLGYLIRHVYLHKVAFYSRLPVFITDGFLNFLIAL